MGADGDDLVSDDLSDEVDGPFVATFTARLPFLLGIPDDLGHAVSLHTPFVDSDDAARFGEGPFVQIRVFTLTESGLPMWPPGAGEALDRFYSYEPDFDPDERFGEDSLTAHTQWVTLETPHARAVSEPEDDPAFAFHRCLSVFNLFLHGVLAATHDIRIRPVTSHDLMPVVIVGALLPDGTWRMLTTMLMHPEAQPSPLPWGNTPITEDQLTTGVHAVLTGRPYMTTILWRSRAQRALRQEGDPADAIISFQIAAEALLFDTYRMMLIDEGMAAVELNAKLEDERPFKSMVTKVMPSKLGGQWDITREDSRVGEYWRDLYLIRNAIIHTGMNPHGGNAEAAQRGYWSLRDHLEARLLDRQAVYPRTALARFGEDGLASRGRLTRRMRNFIERALAEPKPWYWPYDEAGREPPA